MSISRSTMLCPPTPIALARFETPFTQDGSARGSIETQFKRKTFLTVRYGFPFMKTRQEVIHTGMLSDSHLCVRYKLLVASDTS